MKKAIQTIFNLTLHSTVIFILAWLFWPFVNQAIHIPKLIGYDAEQFIFMTYSFRQFFPLPPAGWDHLWYEGIPRVLDSAFMHYYLIQPLVIEFGLNLATKVYPLIWLGIFFFFTYLTLYRLSKNQLIALALTIGLINSQGVYIQIYEYGVVLSSLAQAVFPLVLFFLVLFGQTGSFRFLALAALSLALMFYSHGAMALVFGLTSAVLFLFFCRIRDEKLLSWPRLKRLLVFSSITLTVGALAIFPQVFDAFKGGIYKQFPKAQVEAQPQVFHLLLENTNPALLVAFSLAVLVAILFFIFKRKRPSHLTLPLVALLVYLLVFHLTTVFGINPIGDFLFPGRAFWYFGLSLATMAAVLLSPLVSLVKGRGNWWRWLGGLLLSGVIGWVALANPLDPDHLLPPSGQISPNKTEQDQALLSLYKTNLAGIWDQVNQQDTNVRVWLHAFPKLYWNIISPVSQAEGYFHYYTKYSADWHAWLFATLAEETVENQTIPQEMAEKQALFMIDWYGVKYLVPFPGPEFNLAPRFWGENEYILKRSAEGPPAVLTMKPEFSSGIVEAVNVPVVGFVGSDEGYDAFLRDLGMLNLNTHYLIPLRLTSSIDKLSKTDLGKLDLLVLYNFTGGGRSWQKITDFVKKGGSLFIETGGNPSLREGINLPEIFPAEQLNFGALGKEWQVEANEELAAINFEKLEPLVYRNEPWKVSYVPDTGLIREGSRVLVSQAGKPIVVERKLDQGKIIWSGLNSWYRPWEFKENGMVEVQVLEVILAKLLRTSYYPAVEVKVTREKPEKITIEGNNFSGVVFKENYLPGWKARAEGKMPREAGSRAAGENGKGKIEDLPIFAAGPDLMYVPLPKELENKPVEVSLTYQGPWLYWFLFVVSILSLILVIIEITTNGFFTRRWGDSRLGKFIKTKSQFKILKGWWDKEEG